jgi:hypothetical protein
MARGLWRSCWAWWWGRGGSARSSEEGCQADVAEKEDGLEQRRMVLGGGTTDVVRMVWGRRCGEHGEYQQACPDKTSNLCSATSRVSISNQW